jgi:hypothetical protein
MLAHSLSGMESRYVFAVHRATAKSVCSKIILLSLFFVTENHNVIPETYWGGATAVILDQRKAILP